MPNSALHMMRLPMSAWAEESGGEAFSWSG